MINDLDDTELMGILDELGIEYDEDDFDREAAIQAILECEDENS